MLGKSAMSENPGRSRGRARGRARQADEQARRPGAEPERGGVAASPAAVYPTQDNGGGRRVHRGVPRVDPVSSEQKPAPGIEAVTEAMASMASMSETTGRGRSRFGASHFSNDNTRPKHIEDKQGQTGKSITLLTNYFELLAKPAWRVYQYHCDFAPVVESSRMRRAFMRDHKETFLKCFIFDGMSDLKTINQLGETLELFSKRNTDGETIRITLKRVAELAPSHPELQRLFNTQMKRNLQHLKFQLLGRHYFDSEAVNEVPEYNLQIWQGVITAIRQHEEKLLMCVDTVHKVVRQETAYQIINNILKQNSPDYRNDITRELVGCIVMTRYNNRTYRVEDIDFDATPSKTFDTRDGPVTYIKYYKQQYDIEIKDFRQPLMLCTSKEKEIRQGASASKKIYLIPELCCMTGLTDSMRKNFTTMKELANRTRVDPTKRVANLNRFIQRINGNAVVTAEMEAWGLKFSNNLVQVQGRVVQSEQILIRNKAELAEQGKDFGVAIRSDPMLVAKRLQDWIVICTRHDRDKTMAFLSQLKNVSSKLGMEICNPKLCEIANDRINSYINAFRENDRKNTQLVTFILSNDRKERYDALKKYTCVDNAVPSQCIVSRTIGKSVRSLMTVATKIAFQLNCKLGGEPWAINNPLKRIMVCGYDTYHDSSRKGRSAGAFVASLNPDLTRWFSKVSFHSAGGWDELSNHMKVNFIEALKKYNELNNCLPDIILLYRDGVGDGQIRYVKEWELQQFIGVIKDCMKDKPIRYAFIVVNKRVNTRFFNMGPRNTFSNPPNGTVIDNTVTRFDRYDFFLVSQNAMQGTVSPTMYNIIEDTTSLKPEQMQRFAYKMTHLYYNFSGTISVPAPCQYAHKLAFLAGQSLHQPPRDELCDTLFYL